MLCRCVKTGQTILADSGKIIWVEIGDEYDIQLNPDGSIPKNMEKVEVKEEVPKKKGKAKTIDEDI